MEFNTIQGLHYTRNPDEAGRMFLTDFQEENAERTIETMPAALSKLSLYYVLDGAYAADAMAGEQKLREIAAENPELYVYGIKANVTNEAYFAREGRNESVSREKLGSFLAAAIDGAPERWMPVFKHMLKTWPRSEYWRVVSDVLCRAYREIAVSDEECIRIVARGLLCEPSSWEAAFDAMMVRAEHFENETIQQFTEAIHFLKKYGKTTKGRNGISIPSDIYSRRGGAMNRAFSAQTNEIKTSLREYVSMELSGNENTLVKSYLYRMLNTGENSKGLSLGELETLYAEDPEAARKKFDETDTYQLQEFEMISSPEIVSWLVERLNSADLGLRGKQLLGYRLSSFCSKAWRARRAPEARQYALKALEEYAPAEDSEGEAVLAGCLHLFAIAAVAPPRTGVEPTEVGGKITALLKLHSTMEVHERSIIDDKRAGGIWINLISNYSLSEGINYALSRIIRSTPTNNADEVINTLTIIADTFGLKGYNTQNALSRAMPHGEFRDMLNNVLALDPEARLFRVDFDFFRRLLPSILDALDKVVATPPIYENYYKEFLGNLHIYCSALDMVKQNKISRPMTRLLEFIEAFSTSGPVLGGAR